MDTLTQANKQLLQTIFEGLARGDGKAFIDGMADDIRWTLTGTNAWSGTYEGKDVVRQQLLRPLLDQFATQYTNQARRIIGEGAWVVVECVGNVETKRGERYDNRYCWVCRVEDGKLRELVEYMDTELVAKVLVR